MSETPNLEGIDYLIEAAARYPEVTIEVEPDGVRIVGTVEGAIGSKRVPWLVIRRCRINPLLAIIEDLRRTLETLGREKAKPNPEGFDDHLRDLCRERCAEFGEPPCWELPELVQPCEHITPCAECLADAEGLKC